MGALLDKVSEEDNQPGIIDDLLLKVKKLTNLYQHLIFPHIAVVRLQDVTRLKACIYDAVLNYKIDNEFVMGVNIPSSYHTLVDKLTTLRH